MSYRFLKISSYNKVILADYYKKHQEIILQNYDVQYEHLMKQRISLSDFYQQYLTKKGIEAIEIVANAEHLQNAWKEKYLPKKSSSDLILEQIEFYKPKVVFFQDSVNFNGIYIKELKNKFKFLKLIIGFSCSPHNSGVFGNFKYFDFIITCTDQFKKIFEKNGIKAHTIHHGFEPVILSEISVNELEKKYDFIFIGSLLPGKGFHKTRLEVIEKLLTKNVNLKIAGTLYKEHLGKTISMQLAYLLAEVFRKIGFNQLPFKSQTLEKAFLIPSFPLHISYSQQLKNSVSEMVYGIDMFKLLAQSKIGFNMHGEVALSTANMRVFETTGVGTCLLTDHKEDVCNFFEPDLEIVTYRSAEECIEKAKWLLANPLKTAEIAKKGQERCLKNHSMKDRVELFSQTVNLYI